jgi:hypothetical protein
MSQVLRSRIFFCKAGVSRKKSECWRRAPKSIRVKPCGESGVLTKFTAGGTSREAPEVGYIEASSFYSVTLVIRPDLSVHASGR